MAEETKEPRIERRGNEIVVTFPGDGEPGARVAVTLGGSEGLGDAELVALALDALTLTATNAGRNPQQF